MTSDPFSAALGHHQAGRLDAAAAAYEAIIAALPGHTDALYNLALLRAAAGDNAAAEGLLRRLLALLPDDGATRQALARVLTVAGDYGGAIELFAAKTLDCDHHRSKCGFWILVFQSCAAGGDGKWNGSTRRPNSISFTHRWPWGRIHGHGAQGDSAFNFAQI